MTAAFVATGYRLPWWLDETVMFRPARRDAVYPYVPDYLVPEQEIHEAPEVVQQLQDLIRMAKLADRALAPIIGVSHPTIAQARRGHAGALSRSAEQRQRLADAHMVVSRIYLLAKKDADRVLGALDTPDADDLTALDYLSQRQVAKAYLAAMRALHPARTGEMMVGSHPLDSRTARIAVLDED